MFRTGDSGGGALLEMGREWACIKRFVDDIVKSAPGGGVDADWRSSSRMVASMISQE